jgi:cell division protein ZapE
MLLHVTDLRTELTVAELLEELVPPKEFLNVSFDNYVPDSTFPSQASAVTSSREFANRLNGKKSSSTGIYLDGGFGVGKTHLLASIFHSVKAKKLFGPFIAYTSIIGYLGFQEALDQFSKYDLICIDEFELDDPGDTMMMSRLLKELAKKNVSFAATSNTPPNALGEGRFAADGFQREISSVADRFTIMRIDGEDYRHRSANYEFSPSSPVELERDSGFPKLLVSFSELLSFLASIHQSRYAKVAEQFQVLAVSGLYEIQDQFEGLRFVSFIDRCYEAGISFQFNGLSPDQVFRADHVTGAYQKKYLRCASRLFAMNSKV